MEILGIDIGGSGIKGAPVDVDSGNLLAPPVDILGAYVLFPRLS